MRAAYNLRKAISIHVLREEDDCSGFEDCWDAIHFYPRPPRGGRPERSEPLLFR